MAKKKASEQDIPLFQGIDVDQVHPVETITEEQAEKYTFDTVDFSDPNRPKTCLEVDFPILKVNEISAIEQNATKPIYMMSKWWARRRASVFRQLLISAATRSPKDESKAAQASWNLMYRKSHVKHGKFKNIKVADVFMGGGTTIVEAARLGFDVTGIDLNPIAWWVVKNETTPVSSEKLKTFYDYVKDIVEPQIQPFFIANSPWGFKGKWIDKKTNIQFQDNPTDLNFNSRNSLQWYGSELIYTFWMKHVMCTDPECCHLTPAVSTNILSQKSLKIKCLENCVCPNCGDVFDLEYGKFRMAPSAEFVLSEDQPPFAAIENSKNTFNCPSCKHKLDLNWVKEQEEKKGKPKNKSVTHFLLVNKKWLNGITAKDKEYFGGYSGASLDKNKRWYKERSKNLTLIEVRGQPSQDLLGSNIGKKKGTFICGSCGRLDEISSSSKLEGHTASFFPYLIQGFDPVAKDKKIPYGGRFFDLPDFDQIIKAEEEFSKRTDIHKYVPKDQLWFGHQTHQRDNLPGHGYKCWTDMFNVRQLYINALLLKVIVEAPADKFSNSEKSQMLGAWQNYLRHNCMLTIWNPQRDTPEPHFSNNNYHPKTTTVENGVFTNLGRGNFLSCFSNVVNGMDYLEHPYDLEVNNSDKGGKSQKIFSNDKISSNIKLFCQSSTDLKGIIPEKSIDLVITDPPFGDNVQYAELSDFFLTWLSGPIRHCYPEVQQSTEAPKSLEAVANKARQPGKSKLGIAKADEMYDRLLTLCWKESYRILKDGGIMAFTFHHDKDEAWVNVLDSLFKAGFIIESAFPIRSDSSKGDGEFGSKKIEYDIVHVCKKRLNEPLEIFWATLRKKILESVKSRSFLLAQHRSSGLHLADLEVIIRGEVLEQYSYHYGKVKKNLAGDLMTVREILVEANLIAQNLLQASHEERVPDSSEAMTKIFFSLFRDGQSIEYNAARKRLKGSGASLEDLIALGWVNVNKVKNEKIAKIQNISDRWNSLTRKKTVATDLDQAHFAINCCIGNKQLDGKNADLEDWIESNYKSLFPSTIPLLKYMETNHFGADYKQAIGMAYRTLERTLNKIKESDGEFKKVSDQLTLF